MSRSRDMRALLKEAESAGCKVKLAKAGHYKIYVPNGRMVVCSSTPNDGRGVLNTKAQLRREGVRI